MVRTLEVDMVGSPDAARAPLKKMRWPAMKLCPERALLKQGRRVELELRHLCHFKLLGRSALELASLVTLKRMYLCTLLEQPMHTKKN